MPNFLDRSGSSLAPIMYFQRNSLLISLFAGNLQRRPVRIALLRQPVSPRFGEYPSETLEILAKWVLLTIAQSLWVADFRVLAPKCRKRLSLLPRELPFPGVLRWRPKNKLTAWCGRQRRELCSRAAFSLIRSKFCIRRWRVILTFIRSDYL